MCTPLLENDKIETSMLLNKQKPAGRNINQQVIQPPPPITNLESDVLMPTAIPVQTSPAPLDDQLSQITNEIPPPIVPIPPNIQKIESLKRKLESLSTIKDAGSAINQTKVNIQSTFI